MSRPTQMQLEKLVEFLEENPGIARGHIRTAQARHQTKLKWEEIAITLNSLGGATKDHKSWAKFWADKKYALKKLVAQRNLSASRTGGGGPDESSHISEMDVRLIAVMGGTRFAEGDQELSIPLNIPAERDTPGTSSYQQPLPSPPLPPLPLNISPRPMELPSTQASVPTTPRCSPRVRARRVQMQQSNLNIERQRLIKIEEKRVEAELANAAGWKGVVEALNNLANAIVSTGNKIAEALQSRP